MPAHLHVSKQVFFYRKVSGPDPALSYKKDMAAPIKRVFYYSRKTSYTVIRKKPEDLNTKEDKRRDSL
jgi:hypothetical protein